MKIIAGTPKNIATKNSSNPGYDSKCNDSVGIKNAFAPYTMICDKSPKMNSGTYTSIESCTLSGSGANKFLNSLGGDDSISSLTSLILSKMELESLSYTILTYLSITGYKEINNIARVQKGIT
jgi:hypothetical protein